ncbi:MAG: S1 RNA-binding domain-containing protein [Chloroflexota bacterium]|nr:S1 RNA-binding domain-containing protein [Chloroflexota bacterium]
MQGPFNMETTAPEDQLGALLDSYTPQSPCRHGDIVKGTLVRVSEKSILVDIGSKSDAMVNPHEVARLTSEKLAALQAEQEVYVYVLDNGENNGTILVSLSQAAEQQSWEEARTLMANQQAVELTILDCNKGGVIVQMNELQGFVPGSQLMPKWHSLQNPADPQHRWEAVVGATLKLKIIEVTPEDNRLIFSERQAYDLQAQKQETLKSLEIGSVQEGIVSNIVDFGAFVNVQGVDGLLHISELSWERINHPSEIVKIGERIKVYILDTNPRKGHLSLSLKRLQDDPWQEVCHTYHEGDLVEVEIVNLVDFGAFACPLAMPKIEGLIHISELSAEPVTDPATIVQVGMRKIVRIISLQPEAQRIGFSLKRLEESTSD